MSTEGDREAANPLVAALLANYRVREVSVESRLTELRNGVRAMLAANNYHVEPPVQGRLHAKSIAWRQKLSLAEPLRDHERADLTMLERQTSDWLTLLESSADQKTRELIREALNFAMAYSRYSGNMLHRLHEPLLRQGLREEQADIRRSRNLRQDRVIDQKELEALARRVQNDFRHLKWSAQLREIAKIVNERVAPKKLDLRTIRQYLPAKKWNRRKKKRR